jgi:LysR family transcriptional regulator, low CO2-responsive transcriptional regulator
MVKVALLFQHGGPLIVRFAMSHSHTRRYFKHGTLPQIAVFEAIARLGSFTRAATELHLAQPTVSTQIRKLTDTMGVPLLEQIGKQVYLTDAGHSLHTACAEIFATFARVDEALADLRGSHIGRLQLAAGSGACFLPRLLATFTRRYPGVDISLRFHNRLELSHRLADNEDDLYLFVTPPARGVVTQVLLPNPMVVCARSDHPLAHVRGIPLPRLIEEPFLMREVGSGTRLIAERVFENCGLWPRKGMELASDEAIRQSVAEGLGISIVSGRTLGPHAGEQDLIALDVEGFPLQEQWYFVYSTGKQLSAPARAFVELALAQDFNVPAGNQTKSLCG